MSLFRYITLSFCHSFEPLSHQIGVVSGNCLGSFFKFREQLLDELLIPIEILKIIKDFIYFLDQKGGKANTEGLLRSCRCDCSVFLLWQNNRLLHVPRLHSHWPQAVCGDRIRHPRPLQPPSTHHDVLLSTGYPGRVRDPRHYPTTTGKLFTCECNVILTDFNYFYCDIISFL